MSSLTEIKVLLFCLAALNLSQLVYGAAFYIET